VAYYNTIKSLIRRIRAVCLIMMISELSEKVFHDFRSPDDGIINAESGFQPVRYAAALTTITDGVIMSPALHHQGHQPGLTALL
jgi:hypothetical protein